MRYRLMATYLGVPYHAALGPDGNEATLFSPGPPPHELGFTAAGAHWRKQVSITDLDALWQSRLVGEPCLVLDHPGDRLHITYLGRDSARARQLGLLGDRPGGLRGRGGPAGHRRPDRGAGGLPAVFGHVLAVDEEVPGAMCLVKADGGFEVFSRTDDAQLDVRFFEDEEAAYFYLFGVLAAEAVRSGRLRPGAPNGHVNGSRGRGVFSPHGKRFEVRTAQEVTQIGTSSSYR